MTIPNKIHLQDGDALLLIDVQNDFLPNGSLAVSNGREIIEPLNAMIEIFQKQKQPIFLTRDWHPNNHCSFIEHNGIWPSHCVQNTWGAEFDANLKFPSSTQIISKATEPTKDAYSGFKETELNDLLHTLKIKRVFVGGLATDYCVLNTVKDACQFGYEVYVLKDGIKGVNLNPNDSENALLEMKKMGANLIYSKDIY